MDLGDQARAIRRRWALVACVVVLGLAIADVAGHGRVRSYGGPHSWGPSTIPGWMLAGGVLGFFGGALALVAERLDGLRTAHATELRKAAGWAATFAVMVVLWVVIKAFLFQSFYIPSPSMSPTLRPGDRVLVSKLSYRLHDVHRGDIVVFKRPPRVQAGPEVKDLVKRVVGLPGDTVEARDGRVLVNGKQLPEPYVSGSQFTSDVPPQHIPARHYWVMGDNRSVSEDSRFFGAIPNGLIVGRVFFQVWPVTQLGLV